MEITESADEALWTKLYNEKDDKNMNVYIDSDYLKRNNITEEKFIEIGLTGEIEIEKEGKGNNKVYKVDGQEITSQQHENYKAQNENFKKFCKTGFNKYISERINKEITSQNVVRLIIYMIVLLFVLIAMATFRSPAVALMPDVTPKPLRSQGNAIINLMGGVGGALAFIIYTVGFFISDNPFIGIFACVGGAMLLLLVLFLILVKENKFVKECEEICEEYGINNDDDDEIEHSKSDEDATKELEKLKKAKFTSFMLILASIFMWFMGYNAVSSNLSVYCTKTLNLAPSMASIISGVSMGISALAFIPVGYLAVTIGRKKSIIFGFIFASISFALIWLIVKPNNIAQYLFAAFYLIAGFGLIIANVNTFPMVVELSSAKDVGNIRDIIIRLL